MKRIALALLITLFLLSAMPAAAQAGGCSLIINRNRVSQTVVSGPCYIRDFPLWCRAYVPTTITQGQTIACPVVIVQATPTPKPTPRATPTPKPLPLIERLFPRMR